MQQIIDVVGSEELGKAEGESLLLLLLSCWNSIPLDRPTRWQDGRPSHTINHILKRTFKNYASSKAEYTNTQLDLPGVRKLLLYL
jgi:hypothetical protein